MILALHQKLSHPLPMESDEILENARKRHCPELAPKPTFTNAQLHIIRTQHYPTTEELANMSDFLAHRSSFKPRSKDELLKHSQRVALYQGLLAPVRTLPEDILREMFAYCSEQPHTVASVCYRWRMIALSTRDLWTKVVLSSVDSRSLDVARKHLKLAGGRSGSLLNLTLVARPTLTALTPDEIHSITPFALRSTSITAHNRAIEPLFRSLKTLPHLRSLTINIAGSSAHYKADISLPRLRDLHVLHATYLAHEKAFSFASIMCHPGFSMQSLPLEQLTRLTLTNISPKAVCAFVACCPNLTTLDLRNMLHRTQIKEKQGTMLCLHLKTLRFVVTTKWVVDHLVSAIHSPLLAGLEVDSADLLPRLDRMSVKHVSTLRIKNGATLLDLEATSFQSALQSFDSLDVLQLEHPEGKEEAILTFVKQAWRSSKLLHVVIGVYSFVTGGSGGSNDVDMDGA